MTKIIAILLVLGQFEVAVETSTGYFVATFPDTEIGVTQFLQAIRPGLEAEPGRFYPCVAYDGPTRDVLQSPLAERIGLAQSLRTCLRDPGVADAPWIVSACNWFSSTTPSSAPSEASEQIFWLPSGSMKTSSGVETMTAIDAATSTALPT